MFSITDIKKRSGGIDFEEHFVLKDELMARHTAILGVGDVVAKGNVSYEDGLYILTYHLTYQLTLPSSRSMLPVEVTDRYLVTEAFMEELGNSGQEDLLDDDLVLLIEGNTIDLKESVIDNILLNIPLRVLTPEEEASDTMPSGNNWTVLTQEQYQQQQEQKKKENNPFAALSHLFDE